MACVNKSNPEFIALADQLGADMAESIVVTNGDTIPTLEQAVQMLRASKSKQFTNAANYLKTTNSNALDKLAPYFSRILSYVGGKFYLVKGDTTKPLAKTEIQDANKRFLESVNAQIAPLFTIIDSDTLRTEVIEAIKISPLKGSASILMKEAANDPDQHENLLASIIDQAVGSESERTGIEDVVGKDIVAKAVQYAKSIGRKVTPGRRLFNDVNPETASIAESYKALHNINTPNGTRIYSLNEEFSKKIADAYEAMEDAPNDPEVKAAYEALATETMDQFRAIKDAGYQIEIYEGDGEPYSSANAMIKDLIDNKHLFILATDANFGTSTDEVNEDHPLLQDSGEDDVNGRALVINDIFRFVHDFFGHSERGNGFGPVGEENAWDVHARMYTPLARRAMTAETRGQNSWVNFGPEMRNADGSIKKKGDKGYLSPSERPFAPQKTGLLPDIFSDVLEAAPVQEEENTFNLGQEVQIDQDVLAQMVSTNNAKPTPQEMFQDYDPSTQYQKVNAYSWSGEQRKRFSLTNVVAALSNRFNIPFTTINDRSVNWSARIRDGVITINEARVTPDSPFHEIAHPLVAVLQKENKELYDKIATDLQNDSRGKEILAFVAQEYPELTEAQQIEEAVVTYIGQIAGERNLQKKGWLKQFQEWLNTFLKRIGVNPAGFTMRTTLSDIADMILDPNFTFDLAEATRRNNITTDNDQKFDSLDFDTQMTELIDRLKRDTNVPGETEEAKARKSRSRKYADLFQQNREDIKAIHNYVWSAYKSLKDVNERFAEVQQIYNSKKVKTQDDLNRLTALLNEIEDNIALYGDTRSFIDVVLESLPVEEESGGETDYESNFIRLKGLINQYSQLYKQYDKWGTDVTVEFAFPYVKNAVDNALTTGNVSSVVDKDIYNNTAARLGQQGITDKKTILYAAVKEGLAKQLKIAKQDASFGTWIAGGVMNSRDPITSAISQAIADEYVKAQKRGLNLREKFSNLMKKYRGATTFTDNKAEKEFYSRYMRKASVREFQKVGADGQDVYAYVERDAFHEKYFWDQFYKNKREQLDEKIGPPPSKFDESAFEAWQAKRDLWYAQNTVKQTDAAGKVTRVPNNQYLNAAYAQLIATDPFFKEMYDAYYTANQSLGSQGLRFGVIPQKANKSLPTKEAFKFKNTLESMRKGLGEQEQTYLTQTISGESRFSIPISYTKMLDEKDLSYNLADTVSGFASEAERYAAMQNIQGNIDVVKNFVNGNATLKINKRLAYAKTSSGRSVLGRGTRQAVPIEAKHLNSQLNTYIDGMVYGRNLTKEAIKVWDAKFEVYKKGDKSVDGGPEITTVDGFENVSQFVGVPTLDYQGFKWNEPREVNGYVVKMTRKDWNFSVKKSTDKLATWTALQYLAGNFTSAIVNVTRGVVENFVESTGGRDFTTKDYVYGSKEYLRMMFNGDLVNDLRGSEKGSLISSLNEHYNGIQGEFQDELGVTVQPGVANRLFRRKYLFFLQNGGEHMIQSQLLISMLNKQKVKLKDGSEISLYEARKREHQGDFDVYRDTDWTAEKDANFTRTQNNTNERLHGNFNKQHKTWIQQQWWGYLVSMFRKHLYNALSNRFRRGYVDYRQGDVMEGYYRTFVNALSTDIKGVLEFYTLRKSSLPENQKYALRKVVADVGVFLGFLMLFKGFDDDDDENEINDEGALIFRRLTSESVQYFYPPELAGNLATPTVSQNVLKNWSDIIGQIAQDPTETYQSSGLGYNAGDNKLKVKLSRTLPIYRAFINTMEPERLLYFYQKNSEFGYFKPSAGKGDDEDNK